MPCGLGILILSSLSNTEQDMSLRERCTNLGTRSDQQVSVLSSSEPLSEESKKGLGSSRKPKSWSGKPMVSGRNERDCGFQTTETLALRQAGDELHWEATCGGDRGVYTRTAMVLSTFFVRLPPCFPPSLGTILFPCYLLFFFLLSSYSPSGADSICSLGLIMWPSPGQSENLSPLPQWPVLECAHSPVRENPRTLAGVTGREREAPSLIRMTGRWGTISCHLAPGRKNLLESETNTEEQNLEKSTTLVVTAQHQAALPGRCDSVATSFLSVSTVQS